MVKPTKSSEMFRVHLAEGYPLLSATLKMILEAQPNVMVSGQSASIVQLQNQLSKESSCLLLDYDLLTTDLLPKLIQNIPGTEDHGSVHNPTEYSATAYF